jgi:hypothetical protein
VNSSPNLYRKNTLDYYDYAIASDYAAKKFYNIGHFDVKKFASSLERMRRFDLGRSYKDFYTCSFGSAIVSLPV